MDRNIFENGSSIKKDERGVFQHKDAHLIGPAFIPEERFSSMERYVDALGVSLERYKSEEVLDLFGGDGVLAKILTTNADGSEESDFGIDSAKDLKIPANIFSVDSAGHSYYQASNQNIAADFADDIFHEAVDYMQEKGKQFDLIVSVNGFPFLFTAAFLSDEERQKRSQESIDSYSHEWSKKLNEENVIDKIRSIIKNSLAILREGGEIRCFPIWEVSSRPETKKFFPVFYKILNEFVDKGEIEYRLDKLEDLHSRDGEDFTLNRLVILKKKKSELKEEMVRTELINDTLMEAQKVLEKGGNDLEVVICKQIQDEFNLNRFATWSNEKLSQVLMQLRNVNNSKNGSMMG